MNQKEGQYIISAVVSAYNSEKFMCGCLEDLLSQTIASRLEIVVVDSGSQQDEQSVVREFQRRHSNIVYIRTEERETVYAAWNRGIKAASGKYITNANTDDRHRKDALERMVRVMEEDQSISLVYADAYITIEENMTFGPAHVVSQFRWPDFDPRLLFNLCYVGPQPVWRRKLHDRYGYFDPEFRSAGDYEFWLRIVKKEKFYHIPESLGLYLLSPGSVERRDETLSHHESELARDRHWPDDWGKRPQAASVSACSMLTEHQNEIISPESTSPPALNSYPQGPVPKVSVVVPTYNRPQMLAVALNSIFTQTYGNIEVIVVNDGGDDVSEIVGTFERFGDITCINLKERSGPSAARNAGLRRAKGEYITYLDDDDIFYPQHIAMLAGSLGSNGCKVAYSDSYQAFQEWDGRRFLTARKKRCGQDFDRQRLLIKDYIPILTIMHRRDCIDEVGHFDEGLDVHEDWDLLIRLSQRYDFRHVPAATAEFRTRNISDSITSNNIRHFLDILKKIHSRYSGYVTDSKTERARKAIVDVNEARILQKEHVEISSINMSHTGSEEIKTKISIIMTVRNGDEDLSALEQKIMSQKKVADIELIVIHENLDDRMIRNEKRLAGKIISLRDGKRDCATCRNIAVSESKGDYIIFTGHGAQPVSNYWIYNMVRPFIYYPDLDAITCRQFIRPEADLFSLWMNAERHRSMYFASDSISVYRGGTVNWKFFDIDIKQRLTCFDSISSCVRRKTAVELPFLSLDNTMDIDRDFGIRLLEKGKRLGYLSSTGVYHCQPMSPVAVMKKTYHETKSLQVIMSGMPNFFEVNNIGMERITSDLVGIYRLIHATIAGMGEAAEAPSIAARKFINAMNDNLRKNSDRRDDFKLNEGDDLGIMLCRFVEVPHSIPQHRPDHAGNIFFPVFMNRFLRFSEYLYSKKQKSHARHDDFISCIYKIIAQTAGEIMGSYFVESETMGTGTHDIERMDSFLKDYDCSQ